MKLLQLILLLGFFSHTLSDKENESTANSVAIKYETDLEGYTLPFIERDLEFLASLVEQINNDACRNQCRAIILGLHNLTTWAVEFWDASGKLPEGVLSGSTFHLGNFDECMSIGKNPEDMVPNGIRGQYCLTNVKIEISEEGVLNKLLSPMWQKFKKLEQRYDDKINELHWGMCVPSACSKDDVQDVMETIFSNVLMTTSLQIKTHLDEKSCYKDEPITVDAYDIAYLTVILSVIAVIIIATIYDVFYIKNKKDVSRSIGPQILLAFSMPENLKKLCSPAHDDLKFECISGMKFLAMLFIIAGHTLIFVVSGPVLNQQYWQENTVMIGWLLGSCALLVSMGSISVFYGPRKNFTTVEAAFYSSLHRALWSLGTGWVLLACITDNSGSSDDPNAILETVHSSMSPGLIGSRKRANFPSAEDLRFKEFHNSSSSSLTGGGTPSRSWELKRLLRTYISSAHSSSLFIRGSADRRPFICALLLRFPYPSKSVSVDIDLCCSYIREYGVREFR
ncbi:unnamed protein product [Trichogramma brassicae]|uniref:Nose resistant-to-fluoxetine protein N-terminal domain-containing protein n=1 Tax=Trichogramma brassicae TaxID=86971 RepID=A0A6H5IIG6_9HYME|nr:unnamed protein product [Trichogramma brassicae]